MKSALFLLLLVGLSLAVSQRQSQASVPQQDAVRTGSVPRQDAVRTASDVPAELPVLWDELRGLKELVLSLKAAEVEQRQSLRSVESRLRDGEVEAEQQRRGLDGLEETVVQQTEELRSTKGRTEADRKLLTELNSDLRRKLEEQQEQSEARALRFSAEVSTLRSRLNASESSLEELKKKNSALAAELPFLQTRLRASESTLEQLRRKSAVLAVRLCNTESLMEELTKQTSEFPSSNSSSAAEGSELESLNVRLEELNTNTQVVRSRLESLQEEVKAAGKDERRHVQDQLSLISSRLNSSQLHLDELRRNAADQTGRLASVERQVEQQTGVVSQTERRLDELQTRTTVQADAVKQLQVDSSERTSELRNLLNTTERLLERSSSELQVRLSASGKQLEQLHNHTAALQVRLSVTETQLEHLQTENTAQSVQLSSVESRLTDGHNSTAALEVRLRSSEKQLEQLQNHTAGRLTAAERRTEVLQERLSVGEAAVDQLKEENEAHSALLTEISSRLEAAELQNSVQADEVSSLSAAVTTIRNRSDGFQLRLTDEHKLIQDLQSNTSDVTVRLRNVASLQTALHRRLTDAETLMKSLQTENSAQSVQLSSVESRLTDGHNSTAALEVRLRSSEKQLEQLQNHTAALQVRLSVREKQLEHLQTENTALSFRMNRTDDRLQTLTNSSSDELKVAFSAGLTDSGPVGPFDEETTLVFSKTIANVGGAYDASAGVFTAPVRGLYFFSFTAADYLKGYMGLHLYRNNQPIIFNLELNDHGGYASTSSGVALQLEEGDGVRLSLPASYRLYDDSRNFSIFSGFLLFPL